MYEELRKGEIRMGRRWDACSGLHGGTGKNQVSDLYFFTRQKKMKVYKDCGEKLDQRRRKVILHFVLVLIFLCVGL